MGQSAYLCNDKEMICCEAVKVSGGGEEQEYILGSEALGKFLKYCFEHSLGLRLIGELSDEICGYEEWKPNPIG